MIQNIVAQSRHQWAQRSQCVAIQVIINLTSQNSGVEWTDFQQEGNLFCYSWLGSDLFTWDKEKKYFPMIPDPVPTIVTLNNKETTEMRYQTVSTARTTPSTPNLTSYELWHTVLFFFYINRHLRIDQTYTPRQLSHILRLGRIPVQPHSEALDGFKTECERWKKKWLPWRRLIPYTSLTCVMLFSSNDHSSSSEYEELSRLIRRTY